MMKFKWLFALMFVAPIAVVAWYQIDRTSLLHSVCSVGLPNYSLPSELEEHDLGCSILLEKSSYEGVLITGFEAADFSSAQIQPTHERSPAHTWFTCLENACNDMLWAQLDRNHLGDCNQAEPYALGFASLNVEGWLTASEGSYGHMGEYSRELFVHNISSVGPPPDDLIEEWIAKMNGNGVCR